MTEPTAWEPAFEFYEARLGDDRLVVLLDLNASQHAPVLTHPYRLEVMVPMLEPRPDGLRSSEEAPALFALEDTVVDRLTRAFSALYVGRFVARRNTTLVFYAPAALTPGDATSRIGHIEPYRAVVHVEKDAGWEFYRDFLWPGPYGLQGILNRQLLAVRAEHGDRPEIIREVDHMALFPTRAALDAAAARLVSLGYRIDPVEGPAEDGRWALDFHRDERLDVGRPDGFVTEILDVLLPLDGDYDGWGAQIESAAETQ
jgi:regulator of RNase E activity RraB